MWLRLFGTPAGSHSMVSGSGLFDINKLPVGRGGPERPRTGAGKPRDRSSGLTAVEGPTPAVRDRLGRLAGVPWFPALGDGACSNVGAGCVTPERPAIMIGTSGAMRTVWQSGSAHAAVGPVGVPGRRQALCHGRSSQQRRQPDRMVDEDAAARTASRVRGGPAASPAGRPRPHRPSLLGRRAQSRMGIGPQREPSSASVFPTQARST